MSGVDCARAFLRTAPCFHLLCPDSKDQIQSLSIPVPSAALFDQQQPQIILLKEGTDTSQGKAQLVSNINACLAVTDTIRTTLGPRGMDKLIVGQRVSLSLT